MTIPRIDATASTPLTAEQLKAVADLLGGDVVIAYRPYFAHVFGGAANAVLLSQFWFWTNTPTVKARDGAWFWKSQAEITEETGLTRREILTARRDLALLGILNEEVRGVPATVHYSINKDAVYARLWSYIQARPDRFAQNVQTDSPESGKVVRGKRVNKKAQNGRTISETTYEKKQTHSERPRSDASLLPEKKDRPTFNGKTGVAAIGEAKRFLGRGGKS